METADGTSRPALNLPYFDLILDARERGESGQRPFERYVHWGYWPVPRRAAGDAADLAEAMDRMNAEVLAAAAVEDGQAVLDAGCGFGGTLASIQAQRRLMALTGVNIDARQLAIARAQVPGARFAEADACVLPFGDACFDRVLAVECIFHFPSRARFLREAARVLKPGGRIALSDFVPLGARTITGAVGRWLDRGIGRGYGALGLDWTDGNYTAMARAAGLRVLVNRDVTAHTLPTYRAVLAILHAGRDEPAAQRLIAPTRLLHWVSRLRLVQYRIVGLEKPCA